MAEEQTTTALTFPFEASFTSPIDKVWACIEDFGNWNKWYPHFAECKYIGDGIDKIGAIRVARSSKNDVIYEAGSLGGAPTEQ